MSDRPPRRTILPILGLMLVLFLVVRVMRLERAGAEAAEDRLHLIEQLEDLKQQVARDNAATRARLEGLPAPSTNRVK